MQVDIWCAFSESITDPSLLERYHELLTDAERRQQSRFHFAHDRHRYLITRALVRTTLSRYADVAPESWTFVPNSYGRPAIGNEATQVRGISFNLSHSRGLVVLAVTRDQELGVDTEDMTRAPPLEIADRFFAPAEVASLRAQPPECQPHRFFQYWTLKESYIKARGMGLSLPLDAFAFHFSPPDRVRLTIEPQLQDAPERWRFWQWWAWSSQASSPEPAQRQHMLALCVERVAAEPPPRLVMKEIVPFGSEGELPTQWLACS
jgi:4'-phosphopantetheinyl transferase